MNTTKLVSYLLSNTNMFSFKLTPQHSLMLKVHFYFLVCSEKKLFMLTYTELLINLTFSDSKGQ